MILVACPLALLVIYAGMKLLAQTKKEALGNFFKYISLFLVSAGFFILLSICCYGVIRGCHKGEKMMKQKYMMMQEGGHHGMGGQMGGCMMMQGHGGNMGGCCGSMMMNRECGGREMSHCGGSHEGCQENMENSCHGKKEGCSETTGECPAMKGETCKKDSLKRKK